VEWELVYDLAADPDRIEASQHNTLTTDGGLAPEPALLGSEEWWAAIDRGDLPTHRVDDEITRVYWASMNDWPEFEVGHGSKKAWTRMGDSTRYVPGLRVRLDYVVMRFRSPTPTPEMEIVLKTWVEKSRLRSCDIGPGPGNVAFRDLTTLFRPVGDLELKLIEESGHRRFPPRLPEQPIFYPVLDEPYAVEIARDWNTKDERSGFAGYVTAFHVQSGFLADREVHEAGGRARREYWIPADQLEQFNKSVVGRIDVVAEFVGPGSRTQGTV
jgi:hypothetical protein